MVDCSNLDDLYFWLAKFEVPIKVNGIYKDKATEHFALSSNLNWWLRCIRRTQFWIINNSKYVTNWRKHCRCLPNNHRSINTGFIDSNSFAKINQLS
jgi:hypothetical protein